MSATLQREHWNGQPTYLGDLFRVSKTRGDKAARGALGLLPPRLHCGRLAL